MSAIPLEDYESLQVLETVETSFGDAITNQSVFINTKMCRIRSSARLFICH